MYPYHIYDWCYYICIWLAAVGCVIDQNNESEILGGRDRNPIFLIVISKLQQISLCK